MRRLFFTVLFSAWFSGVATAAEPEVQAEIARLLEMGRLEQAAIRLEELLQASPEDAWMHYALGMVHRDSTPSRQIEATREWKRALELQPSLEPAASALAELLIAAGDGEEAEKFLRERLQEFPTEASSLRSLGAWLHADGREAEGEALLLQATRSAPQDGLAWTELGRARVRAGDSWGAIPALERAIRLVPDSPMARYNLARAYMNMNRPRDAEREMELYEDLLAAQEARERDNRRRGRVQQSIRLHEERLAAGSLSMGEMADLARLYVAAGRANDGRRVLGELASSPEDDTPDSAPPPAEASHDIRVDALAALAVLEQAAGDEAAARRALEQALAIDPGSEAALGMLVDLADTPVRRQQVDSRLATLAAGGDPPDRLGLWRGLLALRSGEHVTAETHLVSYLETHPGDPDALLNLGAVYGMTGQTLEAMSTFGRLVELYPDDTAALFNLALSELRAGHIDSAQVHLTRALDAGEETPTVLNLLARIHNERGDTDRAMALLERSLELQPDQPDVRALLERIRRAGN